MIDKTLTGIIHTKLCFDGRNMINVLPFFNYL